MRMLRRLLIVLVGVSMLAAPRAIYAQKKATRDSMSGVWCGSAQIVVDWTIQKKLGVRLVIPPTGEVTGQIGDARLLSGTLKANRGAVDRMLDFKTDYIIEGKLEGPIIAGEGITRRSVKMPLNWTGSGFRGGVNTDGWKMGSKDHMALSASKLLLRRWVAPVPGPRFPVPGAC